MKADYETLLYRVKDDPKTHLGRYDVQLIHPYFFGYDEARRGWQQPPTPARLDWERFRKWQESKIHLCNQNIQSFCVLQTDTDEDAFELYFRLYDDALNACANDFIDHDFDIEQLNETAGVSYSLFNSPLVTAMRKRPAMYFGNRNWIGSLWSMCSGFLWAERDMGISRSATAETVDGFQAWLDDRHPIGKGRNWAQLFDFLALHSNQGALDSFFEELEMFRNGEPADSPPKWVNEAVANILASKRTESV